MVAASGPRSAGPLTVARYSYYYGERPDSAAPTVGQHPSSVWRWCGVCPLALSAPAPACAAWGCALCHAPRDRRAPGYWASMGIILGTLGPALPDARRPAGRMLAAPPRAGKGTGVVIPNALNWPGSLVCVDIKRENWALTAGFRRRRPGLLSLRSLRGGSAYGALESRSPTSRRTLAARE